MMKLILCFIIMDQRYWINCCKIEHLFFYQIKALLKRQQLHTEMKR